MTGRAALIAAIIVVAAAALPLLLSDYQVGLATQVLIFGMLGDVDRYAGGLCRAHLARPWRDLRRLHLCRRLLPRRRPDCRRWSPSPLGVLAATLVAAVFALLAVRTSGVYFLLLTLALGMIVWGICLRWTQVTGGENGMRGDVRPAVLADATGVLLAVLAAPSR